MMTSTRGKVIGIFGGTFDPVHCGHITIAKDIQQHLQIDDMRLVPCRLPPHRKLPSASDEDRLHMLQLAIAGTSLKIDARELQRTSLSYTVDTLLSLRKEYGSDCTLLLCMGWDAFTGFNHWHRWQEIPTLAHIIVAARANAPSTNNLATLHTDIATLLMQLQATDKNALLESCVGKIYLTQLSQIPVSSTSIREALARGDTNIPELNPAVHRFIQQRGLYQP